jgi:hypothetical protein
VSYLTDAINTGENRKQQNNWPISPTPGGVSPPIKSLLASVIGGDGNGRARGREKRTHTDSGVERLLMEVETAE